MSVDFDFADYVPEDSLIEEGHTYEWPTEGSGFWVTVGYLGSTEYEKALAKYQRKFAMRGRRRNETDRRPLIHALAETVFRKYAPHAVFKGEELHNSMESRVKLLTVSRDLLASVIEESDDLSNFRAETLEEQGKGSASD